MHELNLDEYLSNNIQYGLLFSGKLIKYYVF